MDPVPRYTQNDYNVWRANFGEPGGSGSGASANTNVPEPATLMMLIVAAVGIRLRHRGIAKRVSSTRWRGSKYSYSETICEGDRCVRP